MEKLFRIQKIGIIVLLFFYSCNKVNNASSNDNNNQSNTDLIINKKWALAAISGKQADGTLVPDWYTTIDDYAKDDYYYFKGDLTWSENTNTLKQPGHPEEKTDYGTWTLVNGDQYLQLVSTMPQPPGSSTTYWPVRILELSASKLKLESIDPDGNGEVIWITYKVLP